MSKVRERAQVVRFDDSAPVHQNGKASRQAGHATSVPQHRKGVTFEELFSGAKKGTPIPFESVKKALPEGVKKHISSFFLSFDKSAVEEFSQQEYEYWLSLIAKVDCANLKDWQKDKRDAVARGRCQYREQAVMVGNRLGMSDGNGVHGPEESVMVRVLLERAGG